MSTHRLSVQMDMVGHQLAAGCCQCLAATFQTTLLALYAWHALLLDDGLDAGKVEHAKLDPCSSLQTHIGV
jgi:hypothetical protein